MPNLVRFSSSDKCHKEISSHLPDIDILEEPQREISSPSHNVNERKIKEEKTSSFGSYVLSNSLSNSFFQPPSHYSSNSMHSSQYSHSSCTSSCHSELAAAVAVAAVNSISQRFTSDSSPYHIAAAAAAAAAAAIASVSYSNQSFLMRGEHDAASKAAAAAIASISNSVLFCNTQDSVTDDRSDIRTVYDPVIDIPEIQKKRMDEVAHSAALRAISSISYSSLENTDKAKPNVGNVSVLSSTFRSEKSAPTDAIADGFSSLSCSSYVNFEDESTVNDDAISFRGNEGQDLSHRNTLSSLSTWDEGVSRILDEATLMPSPVISSQKSERVEKNFVSSALIVRNDETSLTSTPAKPHQPPQSQLPQSQPPPPHNVIHLEEPKPSPNVSKKKISSAKVNKKKYLLPTISQPNFRKSNLSKKQTNSRQVESGVVAESEKVKVEKKSSRLVKSLSDDEIFVDERVEKVVEDYQKESFENESGREDESKRNTEKGQMEISGRESESGSVGENQRETEESDEVVSRKKTEGSDDAEDLSFCDRTKSEFLGRSDVISHSISEKSELLSSHFDIDVNDVNELKRCMERWRALEGYRDRVWHEMGWVMEKMRSADAYKENQLIVVDADGLPEQIRFL
jgi:hypothetical protein